MGFFLRKMPKATQNIEVPKHLAEAGVTVELWDACRKEDPIAAAFFAAAPWQDSANYSSNAASAEVLVNLTYPDASNPTAKASDVNWRDLQSLSENKFKTSGPLNRAINLKSDLVAGSGFSVYSTVKEINEYIRLIFNHHRNKLYQKTNGWMNRIQTTELFILIVLDDTGFPFIRVLESQNIGQGSSNKGIITDPDDVTTTLFYEHYINGEKELIPDAWYILDQEGFIESFKNLQKSDKKIDEKDIKDITKSKGKLKYRRFVYHWKNLSGMPEYLRDTSAVTTALEWLNLYENMQKWRADYTKALASYVYFFEWDDSPAGKIGAMLWAKMSAEDKAKHPLMQPLSPGSRLILPQGLKGKTVNPQLSSLTNTNQDMFLYASAGVGIPPDIFTGNLDGSTYASIKSTRPVFIIEIENLQYKFMLFMKELLRICFAAKLAYGGSFETLGKEKVKLLATYDKAWDVKRDKNNKPILDTDGNMSIEYIKVEPVEMVGFNFPDVKVTTEPQAVANSLFGSKHLGLIGVGISPERAVKEFFGIDDFEMELRRKQIFEAQYGKLMPGADAEKAIEQQFTNAGFEGGAEED